MSISDRTNHNDRPEINEAETIGDILVVTRETIVLEDTTILEDTTVAEDAKTLEDMKQRLCAMFHHNGREISEVVKRKLVLHFDVNKTIVPVDSATGETVEAALNIYLSGMAWGKDREGVWHSSRHEPSSRPLDATDVSFYKFEEKRLLPQKSKDRAALRYHLTSFTDHPQGTTFKPYLNTLLDTLKWKLPYDESLHKEMTVPGTKSSRFHFILPSFYTLLNYLIQEERDFTVVFRTYGSDAKGVLKSIKATIGSNMPFCHNLESLLEGFSEEVPILRRGEDFGTFRFLSECEDSCEKSEVCENCENVKNDNEMYNYFSSRNGISAIRDDCEDWYKHGFDPTRGKPLWIDQSDPSTHHIFFDDNIRPGNVDSIVNVRVRESSGDFRNVSMAEEYNYVNTNIVPVVFSEAILNNDYYIQKLKLCEDNYSKVLML
jgi:hypothetical protein